MKEIKYIILYLPLSGSCSGTVINYGSGSTSQKVTVPLVPQNCLKVLRRFINSTNDPPPLPLDKTF